MKEQLLDRYGMDLNNSELQDHVKEYLESFECGGVYRHTLDVVDQVKALHQNHDFDLDKCIVSAYLHDIGRVVKKDDLVHFCQAFGHEPLEGETEAPDLLHQVASRIIASEIFGVQDQEILAAIECHTTLKGAPKQTDLVLFLADKLSWQQATYIPVKEAIEKGLKKSLEEGSFAYFKDLHKKRRQVACYHQHAQEAYDYLKDKCTY